VSVKPVLVAVLALWSCELACATRTSDQLRGAEGYSSDLRLGNCSVLSADESADFGKFKQTFQQHINKAPQMHNNGWFASWFESWHLNTHLLEKDAAPDGLWLKFGVDMSCDSGACDKIGPLAEHAVKRGKTSLFAFDCFKGLPERWRDGFNTGVFARQVVPNPPKGAQWLQGIYQDSLPKFLAEHHGKKIGYLLIDSDLCSSAAFVLDQTYPQLADNALVYFDEIMNFQTYDSGELLAFYRFLKKNRLDYDVVMSSSQCDLHPQAPFFEYPYNQQAAFRLKRTKA